MMTFPAPIDALTGRPCRHNDPWCGPENCDGCIEQCIEDVRWAYRSAEIRGEPIRLARVRVSIKKTRRRSQRCIGHLVQFERDGVRAKLMLWRYPGVRVRPADALEQLISAALDCEDLVVDRAEDRYPLGAGILRRLLRDDEYRGAMAWPNDGAAVHDAPGGYAVLSWYSVGLETLALHKQLVHHVRRGSRERSKFRHGVMLRAADAVEAFARRWGA